MSSNRPLPPKKDVAQALLERSSLFVHLDPRVEKVHVPNWFKRQPSLVLQVGYAMAVPIRDLHFDDEGMSCTLSFNRSPFFCVVPWESVYALVGEDGRAMVWPDDIPPEVAAQAQKQAKAAEAKTRRGHLRAVASPEQEATTEQPDAAQAEAASEQIPEQENVKPKRARKARKTSAAKGASTKSSATKSPATKRAAAKSKTGKAAAAKPEKAGTKSGDQRGRAKTKVDRPSPVRPVETPQVEPPQSEQGADSDKPKRRELPPYLRVVK